MAKHVQTALRAIGPVIAIVLACVAVARCGGTPTQPASATFTVSGTVSSASGGGVEGAHVEVTAGVNLGRAATADSAGHYVLTGLSAGTMTLRASAAGFIFQTTGLTLGADRTANFSFPAAPFNTLVHVVDGASSAAIAGVLVTGDGISGGPSDSAGSVAIASSSSASGPRAIVINSATTVERRTSLRIPGADASISLITSSFDLTAFNQMFRIPMLLRWTTAPLLVVEARALQFTDVNQASAIALTDQMTDQELSSLVADLTWALPQMTGAALNTFAGVSSQLSNTGASVTLLNTGQITVTRVVGLTAATGFWGYGRYHYAGDGTVNAGIITLDRDFERSGSPFLRSLRTHEFGHALGYNHVSARASVMNSAATTEPNAFDLAACRIAFGRAPGNVSPDIDPLSASVNVLPLAAKWSPAIR